MKHEEDKIEELYNFLLRFMWLSMVSIKSKSETENFRDMCSKLIDDISKVRHQDDSS